MPCAALPIAVGRVTSPQGWRNRPSGPDLHTGVDLGAPEGTPVFAMLDGLIRLAAPSGSLSGYGNTLLVEHSSSLLSLYAHLRSFSVATGQRVFAGQLIGFVGRTAGTAAEPSKQFDASGAHLHLEFLSKWPPAGRDLDRLNVATVLAALGVVVPASGPLRRTCDLPAALTASLIPTSTNTSGAGFALLALGAWWLWTKYHPK